VRLLLDTHSLLWWLADDPQLGEEARSVIADPGNEVIASAVSAWEISIKRALGKLSAPDDLEDQLVATGIQPLVISIGDALAAGALPRHHDDPFDRMLVAQAQRYRLTLVTRDSAFTAYGIELFAA
jgi:PIN domain nuclease of toxin-antitoxin system